MNSLSRLMVCLRFLVCLVPAAFSALASAQQAIPVTDALLQEVFPGAASFSEKQGDPPVISAYSAAQPAALLGYVFQTSDLPPEEVGYSAPVDVLVGMDLSGELVGIEVLYYRESYRSIRGDFIEKERFPRQFPGKQITDGFRVGRDIDGISRATITSWAMARGVRNAGRRVARAYLGDSDLVSQESADALGLSLLAEKSWAEHVADGWVRSLTVAQADQTRLELTLVFMGHDGIGEMLVGPDNYSTADREASNRSEAGYLMLVGIDGDSSSPFRQERLALEQDGRRIRIQRNRFVYAGSADTGLVQDRFRYAGAMVVPPEIDLRRDFAVLYDASAEAGQFETYESVTYQVPPIQLALALRESMPPQFLPPPSLDFDDGFEQAAAGLLEDAPWLEVVMLSAILVLVMVAFLSKKTGLRWLTLTATLIYLGWIDGGFVSVSHITNGIKQGPSLFLNDLPLLLIVSFTLITTLLWGRVFCSSLCPFGALQDWISRVVPKRWQIRVPQPIHDRALYIKYGVLGFLVLMVLVNSELSLFQYFEPFGTVFYLGQSVLLWLILALFLLGAVFVPRFYCRYACPLGAGLGLLSLISPWRIARVEQCQLCKVCEQACPTAAIRGPEIDFKECVRCDICDVKLIARSGVCKHDMEEVRVRVKDWQPA